MGLLIGKFRQSFDRVICPRHDNGGVLSFHVLFVVVVAFELFIMYVVPYLHTNFFPVENYTDQRFDGFYNNLVAPTLGSAGIIIFKATTSAGDILRIICCYCLFRRNNA